MNDFNPQPKPIRWHSDKYEKWIRSLPCTAGLPGCTGRSIVHHLKGIGNLSGWKLKAPSWAAMPLCPHCHEIVQGNEKYFDLQWEWISRTLGKAIDQGILKV